MRYLEIKSYSNYTNIYKLMYKQFKWYLLVALIVILFTIYHWFSNNIGWWYITLPLFMYVAILAVPFQNVLKYGPKKLICHLSYNEFITENKVKIPIETIESISILCTSHENSNTYDFYLTLKDKSKPELLIGLDTRSMVLIHNDLKMYLDVPFIYLEDTIISSIKRKSQIEDIL